MDQSLYTNYPPELSVEQRDHLVSAIRDWAIHHGLSVRPAASFISKESDPVGVLATNAPVTLFPSLFPRSCFQTATSVQAIYNELYAAITRDETWLEEIIKE